MHTFLPNLKIYTWTVTKVGDKVGGADRLSPLTTSAAPTLRICRTVGTTIQQLQDEKAGQIPVAHKRSSTTNAGILTAQKPNGFSVDIARPCTVDEPARQTLLLFVQTARKHPSYAYTLTKFLDHICNLQTNIYTLILHC